MFRQTPLKMKKFALVLSGGGFKDAFQIGALRCLKQHWSQINPESSKMKFDVVAGVSVGSGLAVSETNDVDSPFSFFELQEINPRNNNINNDFTFMDIHNTAAQSIFVSMLLQWPFQPAVSLLYILQ